MRCVKEMGMREGVECVEDFSVITPDEFARTGVGADHRAATAQQGFIDDSAKGFAAATQH